MIYESAYTKARIAFIPVGQVNIELIQPVDENSVIRKFIENKGEGFHHIAYKVKDIDKSLEILESKGIKLVDKKSRKVRENERVGFLHPKSTNNVLIELIQEG
jgi:methylmalonyl-CoA epimerase